jgi:O-antigen/teichoic acid export membrane protein
MAPVRRPPKPPKLQTASEADPHAVGPIFRRVVANAGKLLGGRTVNAVLGLAYIALGARSLGVHDFGALVLIHAFAQFLGDVVKFQSWQTLLQYGAAPLAEGRKADFQRVLKFTVALDVLSSLGGVLIGVCGAMLFADRLGWSAALGPAAALYTLSVVFMVPAAATGVLRLFDRFDVMAGQIMAVSVVRLAGSVVAFALDAPLPVFLAVWAAGTAVGFVMLAIAAWGELRRRDLLSGFSWQRPLDAGAPGAWRFAWATNFNATVSVAFTHLVTLMVGALLGPADAALWRIGRQVADAIAKPAKLLIPALYPELARLRAGRGEAAMWRLAWHVGLAASGLGVVLFTVSAFAGEPLLRLTMGADYAPAAGVMTWQVAAAVVGLLTLPLESLAISLGHAGGTVWVRLGVALCYAAVLPTLVGQFGIDAAGAALVVASVALALGMFWLLMGHRKRPESLQEIEPTPPLEPDL